MVTDWVELMSSGKNLVIRKKNSHREGKVDTYNLVPTTFGNQGKLESIFPAGILAFFFKNKGILMTQYILYFDGTVYFHH